MKRRKLKNISRNMLSSGKNNNEEKKVLYLMKIDTFGK